MSAYNPHISGESSMCNTFTNNFLFLQSIKQMFDRFEQQFKPELTNLKTKIEFLADFSKINPS
jgi:hypothetical protein